MCERTLLKFKERKKIKQGVFKCPLFCRKPSRKLLGVLVVRRSWSSSFVPLKVQLWIVLLEECIRRAAKRRVAVAVGLSW